TQFEAGNTGGSEADGSVPLGPEPLVKDPADRRPAVSKMTAERPETAAGGPASGSLPEARRRRRSQPTRPSGRPDGPSASGMAHVRDLTPDPSNRRKHNPRNVGVIVDALHRVGAGRSIVVDENNVILCGNATVDAAAEAGIENVRIIEATGHEIIAVR